MDLDLARHFLTALAIGALIGVEREKKRLEGGHAFGGIRTHMLLAMVGAAAARLGAVLPWAFAASVLAIGAAMVVRILRQRDELALASGRGLTNELAAIGSLLLGGMAVSGEPALAVALGVAMSAVLAYKQPLHGLVQRIQGPDLYAAIKLAIATFIVLPLLPDVPVDPLGALNPYRLWLLVILISALSLVGYVAVRAFGTAHGTALTGMAGGLVSSTATTLAFARDSQARPHDRGTGHALACGVLVAWAVMALRVAALVALVHPPLLRELAAPLLALVALAGGLALRHWRAGLAAAQAPGEVALQNPFSLKAAMRFGALFAVVLVLLRLAQDHAPGHGLYLVSALAGSLDVDAVTLSLAEQARGGLRDAAAGVMVAVAVNTVAKSGLVMALGRGPLRRHVGLAGAALFLTALAGFVLVRA